MIEYTQGNLFDADVEALVNTVNTVGVMGKGVALQFSRQFPEIMPVYKAACDNGSLDIGSVQTIRRQVLAGVRGPSYIINFPTKRHWKGSSQLEYIWAGLRALRTEIITRKIRSVGIPPLGCGLGGLDWSDVRVAIAQSLEDLTDVRVVVFEPVGSPAAKSMRAPISVPSMTKGRAALLLLMNQYLVPLIDDTISLLEVHKLAYFMQAAGESLRLDFVKGRYGPYSTRLRHVLNAIEGHFISGFGDASEEPGKPIELLSGAVDRASAFLEGTGFVDTRQRFQQVERLMTGFETAYGLELLGSVHWVAKGEPSCASSPEEATTLIHAWSDRKRDRFSRDHIEIAWQQLNKFGWL